MGPYYIYKITNLQNGKVYIGQTRQRPPEKRWREHLATARTKRKRYPLHWAIRKYGAENFRFGVIAEYDDVDEWDQAEIDAIARYKSRVSEHGYNISRGGRHGGSEPQLNEVTVNELRSKYATGECTYQQLAREARLTKQTVKRAVRGGQPYGNIGKQLPRDRQTRRIQRPQHAHKKLTALSPRTVARLRREYEQGMTTTEIARRHKLSRTLVKRAVFGRDGYSRFRCSEPPPEFVSYALRPVDIEEMRRLYASGWYGYEQLAREFGITISVTTRAIRGIGRYGSVGTPIPRALTWPERRELRKQRDRPKPSRPASRSSSRRRERTSRRKPRR